nr:hypothetical protein 495p1_00018 [Serratia proteamaculans]
MGLRACPAHNSRDRVALFCRSHQPYGVLQRGNADFQCLPVRLGHGAQYGIGPGIDLAKDLLKQRLSLISDGIVPQTPVFLGYSADNQALRLKAIGGAADLHLIERCALSKLHRIDGACLRKQKQETPFFSHQPIFVTIDRNELAGKCFRGNCKLIGKERFHVHYMLLTKSFHFKQFYGIQGQFQRLFQKHDPNRVERYWNYCGPRNTSEIVLPADGSLHFFLKMPHQFIAYVTLLLQ